MRTRCPKCNYHWSWKLTDGRKKYRSCGHRYTSQSIWDACRLSEKIKLKLLDYFVLGVPVYHLRFKNFGNRKTIEQFFRSIRSALCLAEQCESDKSLLVKPTVNKTQNTQAEQTTNVPPVTSNTPSQPATLPPAGSGAMNVDYEISQMDAQINPVKADDFNDADVSDANMGL